MYIERYLYFNYSSNNLSYMYCPVPGGDRGKGLACQCRRPKRHGFDTCLGWEGPLEKGMATHSSILSWRIPCTEESGGL